MNNLQDVTDWIGLVDEPLADDAEIRKPRESLLSVLGFRPGMTPLVRQIVAIPFTVWTIAIAAWRITRCTRAASNQAVTVHPTEEPASNPSPLEIGQAGQVRRVCRLLLKLSPDEGPTGPAATQVPPLPAAQPVGAPPYNKVVMSKHLDQADDTEVPPMSLAHYRMLVTNWIATENDREEPDDAEEATADMLACLEHRAGSGATPFADFGVWRPFGSRMGRALKFVVHFTKIDGAHQARELNGPASYEDWEKSCRVFVWAMTVLQLASRTRLNKYGVRIHKLASTYPDVWWVIGYADIIMRREHLEKVRRRCVQLHSDGKLTDFDPMKPWDVIFREAAADETFWNEHVDKKVFRLATSLSTPEEVLDPGFGQLDEARDSDRIVTGCHPAQSRSAGSRPSAPQAAPAKTSKGQKRKLALKNKASGASPAWTPRGAQPEKKRIAPAAARDSKTSDGRWKFDGEGVPLCWAFNRKANGCQTPCAEGRSHRCEWCRGPCRAIECSQKPPGWTPP